MYLDKYQISSWWLKELVSRNMATPKKAMDNKVCLKKHELKLVALKNE